MQIQTITTPFFLFSSINCYLVKIDDGFIMIDTGPTNKRKIIEKKLEKLGCNRENLKLIILTHGDFDHSGNAAYFRKKFKSSVAMHKDDSGMVENGNMLWNRNKQNFLVKIIFKLFLKLSKSDRLKPDLVLDKDFSLVQYGFDAKVLELPGHSKGSIGILTKTGEFFCGDLLENVKNPSTGSIIDSKDLANESIEKLRNLQINSVYPGHGQSFPMKLFTKNQ